jgi:hypothetical protein
LEDLGGLNGLESRQGSSVGLHYSENQKCVEDLRLTDPRDDKKRIEDTKGGLLEGSYNWIFENSDF